MKTIVAIMIAFALIGCTSKPIVQGNGIIFGDITVDTLKQITPTEKIK